VANLTASRMSMKKNREIRVFQSNAYLSLDFMNQKGHLVKKSDIIAYGVKMKIGLAKAGDASSDPGAGDPDREGRAARDRAGALRRERARSEAAQGRRRPGQVALEVAITITEQIRKAQR
jgi:hypothetical protein